MKKKTSNSTQQLIGAKSFTRNGIQTAHGELIFFLVSPTNISVLSRASVYIKERHFMQLLSAQPDIELMCQNDCECFTDNKNYLRQRMEEEKTPVIRDILDQDLHYLDHMQATMSTARQFAFVYRIYGESEEQSLANINRIEKTISEQGFICHRAGKEEIKRLLSVYLGYKVTEDSQPDCDGDHPAVRQWTIPD